MGGLGFLLITVVRDEARREEGRKETEEEEERSDKQMAEELEGFVFLGQA